MRLFDVVNYLVTSVAWFLAGFYGRWAWDQRGVRDAHR